MANNSTKTKEKMIQDLRKIAKENNKNSGKFTVTRDYYRQHGKFPEREVIAAFGSWSDFTKLIKKERPFPAREALLQECKEIYSIFHEKFPKKGKKVPRSFHRLYTKYTESDIAELFGTYSLLREQALQDIKDSKEDLLTREVIIINRDDRKISKGKKYFITSAIAGCKLNKDFFASIQTYCNHNNAELIILPMRGASKVDEEYDEEVIKYIDQFYTEIQLNNYLRAKDFKLDPKQINPLTSLPRYGQKSTSLIVASPKQQMITVPVSNRTLPHVLYSTGAITTPDYRDNRIGVLATQDHVLGGLVVEIENKDIFHVRQVQMDTDGGFYDLDKYYCGIMIKPSSATAFIMGDLHIGSEDPTAINAWKECIKLIKPKYVILHDVFDCASINHHMEGNFWYSIQLPQHAKTLETELKFLGETLLQWTTEFKNIEFIVTKGNHDSWLDTFLSYGKYARPENAHNHLISLDLAKDLMLGKNPLEEYIKKNFNISNIKWLDIDDDFKLHGVQLGVHGAEGNNGGRSSASSMELAQGSGIYGHTHSPAILRDVMVVGTSTRLKLIYNRGGGSSWLHSSALLYPNGKRTLIISVDGSWKL